MAAGGLVLLAAGCSLRATTSTTAASAATTSVDSTKVIDAPALFAERCSQCHGLERVNGKSKSHEDWDITVRRMQSNGLKMTDAERTAVVEYLVSRQKRTP